MKRPNPIMIYAVTACSMSWLIFMPLALNHHALIYLFPDDAAHARLQDVLHSLGAFGPMFAAISTLLIFYHNENWQQFIRGYSVKKLTAAGWLLSLSPLFIFAVSVLVSRLITQEWMDMPGFFRNNQITHPLHMLAWFLPILLYGFGEEGGWRGYALPALQARYTALKATGILSLIWICWHIPSFFYRYDLEGIAFIGFALGIFAGAIWLTFLFNYTKGSILAVSLWHLTFNFVSMIGKDEVVLSAAMSVAVMLLAGFVLLKYNRENLSPAKKIILQTGDRKNAVDSGEKRKYKIINEPKSSV